MGKLKTKHGRAKNDYHMTTRAVASHVTVRRAADPFLPNAGLAFRACVLIGRKGTLKPGRKGRQGVFECASGKNPRVAIGKAMAKAGHAVARQRGAFAGYKRKGKR